MNSTNQKVINIQSSEDQIFRQYLQLINGLLSKERRLTGIEIDVLEKMLLINYLYRRYPKEKRDEILFNRITKEKIRSEVYNISEQSFNNILMKLRQKGYITKKSLIVDVPIVDGKISLIFNLEIK